MDHLLTFLPSSPGVPSAPWEQRLPVSDPLNHFSMGTNQRMAQSMGVLCHILPSPYVVQGSLSLSNLGEPQRQALFPPTHILAVQARFAILTRFALGGNKRQ